MSQICNGSVVMPLRFQHISRAEAAPGGRCAVRAQPTPPLRRAIRSPESEAGGQRQGGKAAMSARILVVEDEEALCALLDYNLQKEGFTVSISQDGEEALLAIAEQKPDLVLLDWMLPKVSGIEVCRQIRIRGELRDLPIIMLTARGEEDDRIRGLDTGADDYLTKPFSMTELMARVRAVLRRTRPTLSGDVATFGDIILDRETRRVRRGDREVHLGPTEFRLLDCLLQRPGRVFSREQLLDLVWGRDVYVEARTVDVHVGRLRKALNARGERDPIRTVRASGYALDETYNTSKHDAA
jgi:two-component system phosphate regulon response regulator PhoB